MTSKLQWRSTIVAFMPLLALTPYSAARTASASDTHAASAQAGYENTPMQVSLQQRFRLSSASDVEIGPPEPSPIPA